MDVDGVLTDGTIYLGATGGDEALELKGFDVKDGLGISLALAAGIEVAWVTGRDSPLVRRRAEELQVGHLVQWARDKHQSLTELRERLGLPAEAVAYIGDDLNDLPAFEAVGVRIAVADATPPVREAAHWVTAARGGHGAVREVVDAILAASGRTERAQAEFLARLREEHLASRRGEAAAGQ